jgi:hypothetical protein
MNESIQFNKNVDVKKNLEDDDIGKLILDCFEI